MSEVKIQGEVVVVYFRHDHPSMGTGTTLKKPEIVRIGSRETLTGIFCTSSGTHWADGCRFDVPWDEVVTVIEFETEADFESRPLRRRNRWSRMFGRR